MTVKTSHSGTLYIVATPIGNLEEISPRAVNVLQSVDSIACEDTRHTKKLLTHLGIAKPLTSYYREKEQQKAKKLLQELQDGKKIAIVSDAGTPGISDPGAVLVNLARKAGIPIVPISGPSALTTALSIAGLGDSQFFFAGFPPAKKKARRTFFKQLAPLPWPIFFYESPHRIEQSLNDCLLCMGDRQGMLFRELTKIHEECRQGSLSDLLATCAGKNRGEFVVLVKPAPQDQTDKPEELDELILWYRNQPKMTLKDAVHRIAADLNLPRTRIYQRALSLWKKS
ncbi:MAG TPA: 16S rRNA (cytidine(1402)-2'-O)-methyltransferase [Desulfobulbus sp.]|nr:16S rRNA (cytidine(1402)-2'-O)-methyltransferase [Desulfobulbus sp.]